MIDWFACDVVRGVDVAARSLEPSYAFAQAAYQTWEQETRFIFFLLKLKVSLPLIYLTMQED